MPDVFVDAMGNQMYMALLDTEDDAREYISFILDEQAPLLMPSLYAQQTAQKRSLCIYCTGSFSVVIIFSE